ncbi:MAG: methyltransferase domain-containing protein [Cytophagales bacterium]|nr:methyltransferase domain-containing protein [Rhizobacter sp.]
MAKKLKYMLRMFASRFKSDAKQLDPNVPLAKIASHSNYLKHLAEIGNKEGMRILEIGSREVTGASDARKRFARAEYVGFDYYPGPNVDVVGDAHKLSEYFKGQKFDLIYTSACFEHFAMPWLVATEISKLLRVGGILFVETHFSFSSHERPWHFFQFSDMALRVLFSPALGIECIEAGMSNPINGRFSSLADEYLRFRRVPALYCHSEFLGRKVREIEAFSWANVDLQQVVGETKYPEPTHGAA